MQAVVQTCGQQLSVAEGDVLSVSRLGGNVGDTVTLDRVLLVAGEETKIGNPVVAGARVQAEILDQYRDKKVLVFKYKRRKNYKRTRGHRQEMTRVRITKIEC